MKVSKQMKKIKYKANNLAEIVRQIEQLEDEKLFPDYLATYIRFSFILST